VGLPRVEILIVTLCEAIRRTSLLAAIDSVLKQHGVDPSLLIVVNGDQFDRDLFRLLKDIPGVRVYYQEVASIYFARRLAREKVQADLFGLLDDDDALLPGALRTRVDALESDPAADVVVTNGIVVDGDDTSVGLHEIDAIRHDPLLALMHGNWLASSSALFRTRSIPPEYFDVTIRSIDMTYLAFRVALEKKVLFLEQSTYLRTFSPNSISRSEEWQLTMLEDLEKMLRFPLPPAVRRELRRKYAEEAHAISDIHYRHGRIGLAWRYHLKSLSRPRSFLNYAFYTRHLLALSLQGLLGVAKKHPNTERSRQASATPGASPPPDSPG
jgi:glycosyltransferase involved in cell wall biosynthesis